MRLNGLFALAALFASAMAPAFVHAAQDSANSVITITGRATFEKRSTVVPLAICEGRVCPQPQPYWVLMIEENGIQYELDQIFERGKSRAPESIEMAGVVVRPGSRLVVDAEVQRLTDDYALIVQVHRASVLMDLASLSRLDSETSNDLAPGQLLWKCRSDRSAGEPGAGPHPPFSVEIWKMGEGGNEGSYLLRVFFLRRGTSVPIDELPDALLVVQGEDLEWSARTADGHAVVQLQTSQESLRFVPGYFSYRNVSGPLLSSGVQERLLCDSRVAQQ